MKLNGKILVAVAMVLGAMATTGCKSGEQAAQPESTTPALEQAAQSDAPAAKDEVTTVLASSTVRLAAPPALRVEVQGRAPSAHHVWQRGYWRYDSPRTVYVWSPGYWELDTVVAPYGPPAVRYEDPGYAPSDDYCFVPGSWRWSGREYVWSYGHWTMRRDVGFYYHPRWENVNGHWQHRMERWDHDRMATWEHEHRDGRGHGDHDHRDQGHAGQGHGDQGHFGQGHAGQGHADQGHAGQGHADQGHAGQGHADQGHAGQGHADQGHAGQGHADQGPGKPVHHAAEPMAQGTRSRPVPVASQPAAHASRPVATSSQPAAHSAAQTRRGHG